MSEYFTSRHHPKPRRSSQIPLLPSSMRYRLRVRRVKIARIAAFGRDLVTRVLTVVLMFCLWAIFFFQIPATVSKWWVKYTTRDGIMTIHKNVDTDHFENPKEAVQRIEGEINESEVLPDPLPVRAEFHTRYLTLATMIKNQRRWLREWLEFNLMMGVEHFIMYDNDSTDLPLEILQPYIDKGLVTYIPWPPKSVPPPAEKFKTRLERWQYQWFNDALETCLDESWTIHKQGPCQLAAFADAVRRTKNGVSRWLAIWDVDEFIFPRKKALFLTLSGLLRRYFADRDHIKIWGSVFGTSGHVEHAAERKPGSPLPALLTEEYVYRSELYDDGEYPWGESVGAENSVVEGKGLLKSFQFGGGDAYGRKSLADPDMVSHSWIHNFEPPGNWREWNEEILWIGNDYIKFNHYAFLSEADARRKSEANKNPFMNFSKQVDEFFSREKDTEVFYLLPRLKERMLESLKEHPPIHADDWNPSL